MMPKMHCRIHASAPHSHARATFIRGRATTSRFKTGEMLTHTTCSMTASRFAMRAHATYLRSCHLLQPCCMQCERAAPALYAGAARCFCMFRDDHQRAREKRLLSKLSGNILNVRCCIAHGFVRGPRLADFMTRACDVCAQVQVRPRSAPLIVQASSGDGKRRARGCIVFSVCARIRSSHVPTGSGKKIIFKRKEYYIL